MLLLFGTSSQYFRRMIPLLTSTASKAGHPLRNFLYSSSVQKPMTCSTPARLYQLRSKITVSPPAGSCSI